MAVISNYAQLKAAVANIINRDDLSEEMDQFYQTVHTELTEIVGPLDLMVDDGDTNALMLYQPTYYTYGMVMHAAAFIGDDPMLNRYSLLYLPMISDLQMGAYQHEKTTSSLGRGFSSHYDHTANTWVRGSSLP